MKTFGLLQFRISLGSFVMRSVSGQAEESTTEMVAKRVPKFGRERTTEMVTEGPVV